MKSRELMINEKKEKSKWRHFVDWVNGEEVIEKPERISFQKINKKILKKLFQKYIWSERKKAAFYLIMCTFVCVVFIGILLHTVSALPYFGSSTNPASNEVVQRYIESGVKETGATNIVTGMILEYRAFDTFGEANVLFLAAICVVMLLKKDKYNTTEKQKAEQEEEKAFDTEDENIILKRVANVLTPLLFLFGIYVVLNGHISPGGGFSGGAIMGGGLILYACVNGQQKAQRFFTYKTFLYMNVISLLTYCLLKGYSFFTGANHLPDIIPKGVPGELLSGGLILPLNICVGIIVMCTIYGFYALFTKGDI